MKDSGILQLDGAHNANATANEAWKVTPELFVQHAINTAYSNAVGMPDDLIALSTVPPTAPPTPKMQCDLPYAVALRELFAGYKFRAQQNTRYMESDTTEATITHVLDTLISRMTSADIQSTITPDEGRNIPWHYNNVVGVNTARQTLMGLDGLMEQVELKQDGPLRENVREFKERAVLFLEEILEEAIPWPEGSNLKVDVERGNVIAHNTPTNLKLVEGTVRSLDIPPTQILVEARICEVFVDSLSELALGLDMWDLPKYPTGDLRIDSADVDFDQHTGRWLGDLDDFDDEGLQFTYLHYDPEYFDITIKDLTRSLRSRTI